MKIVTSHQLTLTGKIGEPALAEPIVTGGKFLFVSEATRREAYSKLDELWLVENLEEPCPVGSAPGAPCEECGGTGVVRKGES